MQNNIIIPAVIFCFVFSASAQERDRTDHWNERNALFEQEQESAPRAEIVFLGNSIIEGFDLDSAFPEKTLINRGIVGDHLDGLIERLENSALALEPRKIFLMIGINDIGDGRDDAYLQGMYSSLLDTLQGSLPNTKIYLHSILPTSPRWKNCPPEQIKRMNQWLVFQAIERQLVYVNLYPYFAGDSNYIKPALSNDGLHPNQQGYAVWAAAILRFLD
ncbi:MAG: hypothetical protein K9M49_01485 [Candidatus Marinimicrobia bacterium]|nr:hypothetical protein [Candidatus Neomarinimicrobiota bacterium]MCF7903800.1 hypothetical protein [Candidatus Neomarinimicrobiota bacterium]